MPAAPTGLPTDPTEIVPPLTVLKLPPATASNVADVTEMPVPAVLPSTVTLERPVIVIVPPVPFTLMPVLPELTVPLLYDTDVTPVPLAAKAVPVEVIDVLLTSTVVPDAVPPLTRMPCWPAPVMTLS